MKEIYRDETATLKENPITVEGVVIKMSDGTEIQAEKSMVMFIDGDEIKVKFTSLTSDELDLLFYGCREMTRNR